MLKTLRAATAALALLSVPALAAPRAAVPAVTKAPVACTIVNLNTASARDLDAIPQVGAARAKQIIAGRPYASVADVARVVPQAYPAIKGCLKVETVNVNSAPLAQIEDRLPGIGMKTATRIVAGRPYGSVAALSKVVTPAQMKSIAPLVTIN